MGRITEKDVERKMEMEREKNRIRREDFKKWQRESNKIERERAKNTEIEMEREMVKEKEREKAHIWCEADQLACHKQQQQQQKQQIRDNRKELVLVVAHGFE